MTTGIDIGITRRRAGGADAADVRARLPDLICHRRYTSVNDENGHGRRSLSRRSAHVLRHSSPSCVQVAEC